MMPKMNPEQLAKLQQLQQITQHIFVEVEINKPENTAKFTLTSKNAAAAEQIPELLDQLVTSFAQQLESFFGIKGKIIEVG